jgi:hypothetical protein
MRRSAIVGLYLGALVVGYVCGATGVLPYDPFAKASTSTPLTRLGYAVRTDGVRASREDWAALRQDIDVVRAGLKPDQRPTFDLMIAARGLESEGQLDFGKAEVFCRSLGWQRCDRASLQELGKRARP